MNYIIRRILSLFRRKPGRLRHISTLSPHLQKDCCVMDDDEVPDIVEPDEIRMGDAVPHGRD